MATIDAAGGGIESIVVSDASLASPPGNAGEGSAGKPHPGAAPAHPEADLTNEGPLATLTAMGADGRVTDSINTLIGDGLDAHRALRFTEACEAYSQAIRLLADSRNALAWENMFSRGSGTYYGTAQREHARLLVDRGLAHLGLGRHGEAGNDFSAALQQYQSLCDALRPYEPRHARGVRWEMAHAYVGRGMAYLDQCRISDAMSDFQKARRARNGFPAASTLLGDACLLNAGREEGRCRSRLIGRAREQYRKALDIVGSIPAERRTRALYVEAVVAEGRLLALGGKPATAYAAEAAAAGKEGVPPEEAATILRERSWNGRHPTDGLVYRCRRRQETEKGTVSSSVPGVPPEAF